MHPIPIAVLGYLLVAVAAVFIIGIGTDSDERDAILAAILWPLTLLFVILVTAYQAGRWIRGVKEGE